MDTEKPSTRHFPGGIRDEPEERRHHDLRLNHLGAIEARCGHHRRVRYPARDQDVNGHSSTVQILRHNRAERLECGLGGSVSRGAGVQHRAETGCDVDDPSPAWRIISGTTAFVSASGAVVCTATK